MEIARPRPMFLTVAGIYTDKKSGVNVVVTKLTPDHVLFYRPGEPRKRRLSRQRFIERYRVSD